MGEALLGLLVGTLVGIVGSVLIVVASGYAGEEQEDIPLWVLGLGQIPLSLAYLGVTVVILRRHRAGPADLRLAMRPLDVPLGLVLGVLAQVAVAIIYLPVTWWTDLDPSEEARELTDRVGGTGTAVILVLMVVVLAPVVEELFFRGTLLQAGRGSLSPRARILVSGVVFGAVHLQPLQFVPLALLGIFLAVLVERTGRLGLAIWTHVGFNGITTILLLS